MRFLLTLLLSAAVMTAQDAAQQRKNTIGEVQSNDTAAKQLKIKTDTGAIYTVTTGDKTNFLRVGADLDLKKATKIDPADIHAGDRVLARGPVAEDTKAIAATSVVVMTKSDVAQKQQKDREEWVKRGVAGTITAIDPDKHEISIRVDTIPPKTVSVETSDKVEYRRYAPDSVKFSDAKASSFAELKVGDRLRALADKSNDEGTQYKAEEIVSGSFRTLAAQVISVDAASNVMKVTDLSSKDKQPLTVHVSSDTTLRRMPETMARMLAARLNGQTRNGAPGGPQSPIPGGGDGANRYRQGGGPGGRPDGAGAPPGGPGGNADRGGFGPGGGRGGDLHQMLELLPQTNFAELKAGDAIIISSTNGADRTNLTAITIVAGVEPILASAPRSAGAVDLGSWNFDIGMPSQ